MARQALTDFEPPVTDYFPFFANHNIKNQFAGFTVNEEKGCPFDTNQLLRGIDDH